MARDFDAEVLMEPGRVSTDREALIEIQAALRRYADAFDVANATPRLTPELLRERDAAHDALLALARRDTQPPLHRDDDHGTEWARGYYCAVAILLREDGLATPHVRSLYRQGGGAEHCDPDDAELFRAHGMMSKGAIEGGG